MNISEITQTHNVIIGSTDSGKSTFAQYLFENTPYKAIYYDVQEEREPPSNNVILLTSPFTLPVLEKYNKIVIYAKFEKTMRKGEIANLINLLFRVGAKLPKRTTWCNLFVDEAHEIAPLHDDDNPLNRVATKGLRYGISLTCMTQRPAMLHNTILTQAKNHFFFNINFYETPYFNKFKLAFEEIEEHIKQPYHFAHWDGRTFIKYQPLNIGKHTVKRVIPEINQKVNKGIKDIER